MLEFVIYFILICGVILFGISIMGKIKRRKLEDEIWKAELEIKESVRKAQEEYVYKEAQKFYETNDRFKNLPVKQTFRTPNKTTVMSGQTLVVSEKKLRRDNYYPDTYCEPDAVPVLIAADIATSAAIMSAMTSSYEGNGGQFDGGGASDSYEDKEWNNMPASSKCEPEEPEKQTSSYSEPDSSSSCDSNDD